jgi:hypothetical protein
MRRAEITSRQLVSPAITRNSKPAREAFPTVTAHAEAEGGA